MTLSERIRAHEACAVVGCEGVREKDSLFCRGHLADMAANRLDRQPNGTFLRRRIFVARDETSVA